MTVKTYERIGSLIENIKRSKATINNKKELIEKDLKELNSLLKDNGEQEFKLEDIKTYGRYGSVYDDEF